VNSITLCCALLAARALAQEPVSPEDVSSVIGMLNPEPAEKTLACEIRPISPALGYRLVYQAGYSVTLPMEALAPNERKLGVLARITPVRPPGRPLVLADTWRIPAADSPERRRNPSKFEAQARGGFFLGEGKYRAELVVFDSRDHACRKTWDLELKPRDDLPPVLPPGHLAALLYLPWPQPEPNAGRLTIFLHAGSARAGYLLLESLVGIVLHVPFSRIQVVTFSLDHHKELLRLNLTGSLDLLHIRDALREFNPGTISYDVLKDRVGHRDFLWRLLARETLRPEPPDAVVFLGFTTLDDSQVFVPPACGEAPHKTAYAYFNFVPLNRRSRHEMPDAISRVTQACSGHVFHIYTPSNLASALEKTLKTR
jgi:hypothetical protein